MNTRSLTDSLRGKHLRGPVTYVDATGSTNDDVRALALAGAPEGAIIVAGEQTHGRGRQGRVWLGRKSQSLLFSVLLRPPLPPADWPCLASMAGLATAEACTALTGCPVKTKWPNDVVFAGRKLAGLLLESRVPEFAVLGIGLNVNGGHIDLPTQLRDTATSLEAIGEFSPTHEDVLAAVVNRLDAAYDLVLRGQTAALLARQSNIETTIGKHLVVALGDQRLEGTAVALTAQGHLVLATSGGEVTLSAGEVVGVREQTPPEQTPQEPNPPEQTPGRRQNGDVSS